ncbi:hypothetical protein OHB12_04740 [Nocardia sp. NBC_01730]|uniref:hypothetical protein n=1 Tax=Nocardia sp. NBC_01730 TaxID=2975998 RepID=UPI002E137AC8|nr:hypothetical protein OHB12_04740 [Nocardia sp. NBC_01730]
MSWPADFVVLQPDGAVIYGSRDRDQGWRDAIRAHVPDLSTQGIGRVRAWFADDFASLDLRPNPLADQVLAHLGYRHPSGWYGPVAVTMEENMAGDIPPLSSEVRETVNGVLATANSPDSRTADIVDTGLPADLDAALEADIDSASKDSVRPSIQRDRQLAEADYESERLIAAAGLDADLHGGAEPSADADSASDGVALPDIPEVGL